MQQALFQRVAHVGEVDVLRNQWEDETATGPSCVVNGHGGHDVAAAAAAAVAVAVGAAHEPGRDSENR